MRKFSWLLPLLLLLSCSRGEKVEITGFIENADKGMIYLDEQGISEIRQIDSVRLKKDGSFRLKDRIENPTFYNLHTGNQQIIPLLLTPGTSAEIHADIQDFINGYEIYGSKESLYLLEMNRTLAVTKRQIDSIRKVLQENPDAGEEFTREMAASYDEIIQGQRRYSIQFILEHISSMASIYTLYQKIDDNNFVLNENRDIQLVKITSESLDTIWPGSEHVQALKRDAANLEENLYSQRWRQVVENVESTFPEIRLPDPNGDTIALSSLKGKVILLSFWASWDPASVSHNIPLKGIYSTYHSRGLEIYQVSFDNEREAWVNAIQFDELPWVNVSELSYPESSVAHIYNLEELPVVFLIDRKGEIVGKNFNRIDLDRNIQRLLNEPS
ncbi:MAG: TlpA disulfide reductase family protein [Bacteroidales bacterium]